MVLAFARQVEVDAKRAKKIEKLQAKVTLIYPLTDMGHRTQNCCVHEILLSTQCSLFVCVVVIQASLCINTQKHTILTPMRAYKHIHTHTMCRVVFAV